MIRAVEVAATHLVSYRAHSMSVVLRWWKNMQQAICDRNIIFVDVVWADLSN